ncbi:MAG: hypothetical protein V4650_11335 [Pseudomonadota bacterium]
MRTQIMRLIVCLLSTLALTACGGSSDAVLNGSSGDNGTVPAPPGSNMPLAPMPTLKRGCDWMLAFDPRIPSLGNTAFPDTSVRYWIAYVAAGVPAGTVLRIEGRYPVARYASLKVHDGNLLVLDGLADYQIAPDAGQSTPFLDITTIVPNPLFGGGYTARLQIGRQIPAAREPNTLYREPPGLADGEARRTTALVYRTYLPASNNSGQVGLPRLRLETSLGELPLDSAEDASACAAIGSLLYQDGAALHGVTNVLDPLPALPNPRFKKFDPALLQIANTGVGLNEDNGFAYIKTDRHYGELLLVRGLPPSHTGEIGAGNPPQVRYWSLCQYGFNTQKVYGCVPDLLVPRDSTGRYTLVVASDSLPVSSASPALGFSTLPFGPERQGVLTLRELLAHPTFSEAIARTPAGNAGAAQRGIYQPEATYCSRAVFDASAAQGAAAAFAACLESRRLLPTG